MLDVFSYVGAWAVSAFNAGANQVTCIDTSELALEYADDNAQTIGKEVDGLVGDALDVMRGLHEERRRYEDAGRRRELRFAEQERRKRNQR